MQCYYLIVKYAINVIIVKKHDSILKIKYNTYLSKNMHCIFIISQLLTDIFWYEVNISTTLV